MTIDPSGRRLWVGLGSASQRVAIVDVSDRARPRLERLVRPPFLAHDVGFDPGGEHVWVTSGNAREIAVFDRNGRLHRRQRCFDRFRRVGRARQQIGRNNPPGCGRAAHAQPGRVHFGRFVRRQRVHFEQSVAAAHRGCVIEGDKAGNVSIRISGWVLYDHPHVGHGRIR